MLWDSLLASVITLESAGALQVTQPSSPPNNVTSLHGILEEMSQPLLSCIQGWGTHYFIASILSGEFRYIWNDVCLFLTSALWSGPLEHLKENRLST